MLSIYKPLYLHNFQPNVQLNIMEQSFIAYIENSIKENWDLDALTDYKGATLQYKDVARKIEKLHIIFEASGIKKGDKIAVCGRNSSHWGVTFLATLTYGAVIVPILHEFKADNVHNIVNHSEAKLLFVGDQVWENLNESAMPLLEGIMMMAAKSWTMPANISTKCSVRNTPRTSARNMSVITRTSPTNWRSSTIHPAPPVTPKE